MSEEMRAEKQSNSFSMVNIRTQRELLPRAGSFSPQAVDPPLLLGHFSAENSSRAPISREYQSVGRVGASLIFMFFSVLINRRARAPV